MHLPAWIPSVVSAVTALIWPVLWCTVLVRAVRRDPRRLRIGLYLLLAVSAIITLIIEGIGLLEAGPTVLEWTTAIWLVLLLLGTMALPLALIANGVTMIRRESRSLGNLLSLLVGIALLGSPAILLFPLVHYAWWTLTVSAVAGGLIVTVAYLFLIFVAYTCVYALLGRGFRGHAVIVLGAQVPGGRVPPLLAARLRAGLAAARRSADGDEPVPLVPSGGQGPDEPAAEGAVMGAWLIDQGVPDDRVLVEDRARTTDENLRFSVEVLTDVASPYLVATSNYHVPRAALLAHDLGIDAQVVGGQTAWYYLPSAYLREFVAVLRARRIWVVVAFVPSLALAVLVADLTLRFS